MITQSIMHVLTKKLNINSKYYTQVLSIIKSVGGKARLIGGCVRDALLGIENKDVDIATTLTPSQITELFLKHNITVIPTGLKFGTVTALFYDEKFEITTLRKDISCNGRHTEVLFTEDFEEDAQRRDFTINALSYDPFEEKIYDYFTGIEDLQNAKVMFIGNAAERIREDYLRILRFFRFSSYYAKHVDPIGFKAAEELKDGLTTLSKERIKWEIDKLLGSYKFPYILQIMFSSGILPMILPVKHYIVEQLEKAVNLELTTKYALLFYHNSRLKISDLINLKFARRQTTQIISLIKFITQDKITKLCLRKLWLENTYYKQYIYAATIIGMLDADFSERFIAEHNDRIRPTFPITGYDLQKVGINGKAISEYIKKLKDIWIENNFTLSKIELMQSLEEYTK